MWTDRSKLNQGYVGATIYQREKIGDLWGKKVVFLDKNKEILDTELQAISIALDIVAKKILDINNVSVTIFYDLQKA